MRWKSPEVEEPKEYDRKCVKKFALFPTKVEGHIIWLEHYIQWYRYINEKWYGYGWCWWAIDKELIKNDQER